MTTLMMGVLAMQLGARPPAEVVQRFEEHTFHYTGGSYDNAPFKYRLLKPAQLTEGKKYPLVLFLHGAGERGDDNQSQLQYFPQMMSEPEYRQRYECFLLAPQCPTGRWWGAARRRGEDAAEENTAGHPSQAALGMLQECLQKYPIDRKRVYLTGLSMGGYGSWDLAVRHPELFAAVVPICGGGDESQAARLVGLPIWAVHGGADPVVPAERSRRMIDAIKKAGGGPKYTELEGVGHDSWTPAYHDPEGVVPWMFEHVKPEVAKSSE
jgi:predicted peptidase